MGRLRNISQSIKAAAFPHVGGSSSPTTANSPQTPNESPTREQPLAVATESPSTTTLVPAVTTPSSPLRPDARPISHFYDPPTMGSSREDNIEELRPVFSFLNSHANKLYQEGYFLKLNDLDANGKPNTDRNWTECFAQLVGTVLSLWDAAALDAAGHDGEVPPTFINLADASIKMIETLPTRNANVQPLQNVLSVSTAGKNRYLFHFNSLHSLTQWTAGIRLAMFEHASLHELYTGSLIAGKGKTLNNIKSIMGRLRYREEDWCRVRFGAGTPWRRCWFTIDPPDEKEWQKANKQLKKKGAYERTSYPKGNLKFFDTKKTKKATPVATISDVYAAYAVYPESKPLIDQSTLVKLEGKITIHSKPESNTEGFVFIMPEVHPAVSGFEILLRFLFPIYDTFALYGRPNRLIADSLDSKGLMFAMPKDRRYGYLDIIDVAGLIHSDGSEKWTEREWRKRTKELVSRRMSGALPDRTSGSSENPRRSLGSRPAIRFGDSSPIDAQEPHQSTDAVFQVAKRPHILPPAAQSTPSIQKHVRSVSENMSAFSPMKRKLAREHGASKLALVEQTAIMDRDISPPPLPASHRAPQHNEQSTGDEIMQSTNSSDSDLQQPRLDPQEVTRDMPVMSPPTPVGQPTFNHQANDQPARRPRDRPDLRREKSRMSNATLSQLVDANRNANADGKPGAAAAATYDSYGRHEERGRGVNNFQNPEDIRIQANPAPAAVNTNLPYHQQVLQASQQKPVQRPLSQHSIARKPVAYSSLPVTPTEPEHQDRPRRKMEDPELLPVFAEMHLPSLLPEDRARKSGGVRKTVGDPSYDQTKKPNDLIAIDFGVTRSLNPATSRPNSGGRISPLPPSHTPPASSPTEEKKFQYGRVSPVSDVSRPNSYVWQPGSQPAGRLSPRALTPEEFVQQRAATARSPYGYSPRRNKSPSAGKDLMVSPTTTPSPNKLQKKPNSRSTSADRTPATLSNMTNGPLLSLAERTRRPDSFAEYGGPLRAADSEPRYAGSNSFVSQNDSYRHQPLSPQFPVQNMQQLQSQHIQQSYAAQQGSLPQQQYAPRGYPPQQFPNQYPAYRPRNNGSYQQY